MSATGEVWVVDDNLAVAESLVLLLLASGVSARAMVCGGACEVRLRAGERPALLVLDLLMPGNGNATLAAIAARPDWSFPIFIITGREDLLDATVYGRAARIFPKAADPGHIVREIKLALSGGLSNANQVPGPKALSALPEARDSQGNGGQDAKGQEAP